MFAMFHSASIGSAFTPHAQRGDHARAGPTRPTARAAAQRSAPTWVLWTTAATGMPATAAQAGRLAGAEPSRDEPHHGAVRAAGRARPPEAIVAQLLGGVCWASTGHMARGQRVRMDLGG